MEITAVDDLPIQVGDTIYFNDQYNFFPDFARGVYVISVQPDESGTLVATGNVPGNSNGIPSIKILRCCGHIHRSY